MKLADNIEIKGNFKKHGNIFISKDSNIISERKGSIVKVTNNRVSILADVTGIDKVYFEIKNNKLRISDIFKDFLGNEINNEFIQFQEEKGYVPYPFTILKNVRKAPPGIITEMNIPAKGRISYKYKKGQNLNIFNENKKFKKKYFRKKFEHILKKQFTGTRMISSFSGGIDSFILTEIYMDKCKHILHFHDNKKVNIFHYQKRWPNSKWIIINDNQEFSEDDRKEYFKAIDEPSCDSAGFAEYLMAKNVKKQKINATVMNGQGADGLFCNGKQYFKEFFSNKIAYPIRKSSSHIEQKCSNSIISKITKYTIDTEERSLSDLFSWQNFSDHEIEEFKRIYSIYKNSINNDSTNFYAALTLMLRYSLHGIEKIRTSAKANNIKYYLPFTSFDMIKFAFSIPSKQKVGFNIGKRILINAYPELKSVKRNSGAFLPTNLKKRFTAKKVNYSYNKYFTRSWIKYNLKNKA